MLTHKRFQGKPFLPNDGQVHLVPLALMSQESQPEEDGGPSRVIRDFEKHCFEPVNAQAFRAGWNSPLRSAMSEAKWWAQ